MSVPTGGPAHQHARLPKVACGCVVLALISVLYATSGEVVRERKVVLGRIWPATDLVPIEKIDHRDWDRLLRQYVDEAGHVDYSAWKGTPDAVRALDAYLNSLSRANPALAAGREMRLAYWINAYNAVTIRGILREYPTASIQNHTSRLRDFNIWRDLLLRVGERDYSLGQIENELLRPLQEPRIHFAIVCASRGCPRLLNRAYQSSNLEQQLRENSRNFFADPQKLDYDSSTGRLRLSPILKWYAKDFGGSGAEMLKTIAPYLPDGMSQQLPAGGSLSADFLDYDWSLNDREPTNAPPPLPP
jgi:hypothetical protein